jgi:urease accessory protein
MADGVHDVALGSSQMAASSLPLTIWLSPAFPVGSFAYSHALEWAVQTGQIRDLASACDWIGGLFQYGGLRNDAILLSVSWRATCEGDHPGLSDCNDLALALAGSRERNLETSAQGNAFMVAIAAAWACQASSSIKGDIAYPVAVGLVSATYGIALATTLEATLTSMLANLASALVRLSTLGQSDGQRLIAAHLPTVRGLAAFATNARLDDIGGAAFQSDIGSLRHETQHTRLFRT